MPVTISALVWHADQAEALAMLSHDFGELMAPGLGLATVRWPAVLTPAIVTLPIPTPVLSRNIAVIADMETCLAAAFFSGAPNLPEGESS